MTVGTSVVATAVAPSSTTAVDPQFTGLRSRFASDHDDPCEGEPPFRFGFLPSDIEPDLRRLDENREGKELYDPVFFLGGDGDRRVNLYHGNSWRLAIIPKEETALLGRPAVVSAFKSDGRVIVEFQVDSTGSGCDWWAVAGHGVSDETILRVAQGLRPR